MERISDMIPNIVKYKVIADYPASMYNIGDTIEVYAHIGRACVVEIDGVSEKYDVRDYSHLFKLVDCGE